jgi:hypothetical protein
VCAEITDRSGVSRVTLRSDKHGDIEMSLYAGNTYCANLTKKNGQTVTYFIMTADNLQNPSTTPVYSYRQE